MVYDPAARLSLMRSGQADYLGPLVASDLKVIDEAVSLQKTNPRLIPT